MTGMRMPTIAAAFALASILASPAATWASSGGAATQDADAAAPVMAVWVPRKVTFQYMGFTSHYSCDGLKDKVSTILAAIGAQPGFRVTARGCLNPRTGAERAPVVEIVAALPHAATPEILAEAAAAASKQELAEKAGGKPDPVFEAAAEFPAVVQRVEFRDSQVGPIEAGDCELLDQMRDGVFAPLGVKVVVNQLRCVPHQILVGSVALTVEVLQPLPEK